MINQCKLMFKKNIACELNFQPNAQSVIYTVIPMHYPILSSLYTTLYCHYYTLLYTVITIHYTILSSLYTTLH